MLIKKIFNNNVLLVLDSKGLERILIGRGIAFGRRIGQPVQKEKIEKTFIVDSLDITGRFAQLTKEVPINHLELVTKIIKDAEKALGHSFSDLTYIGLADHINYALNRYRKGQKIRNALLWEIKKFYPIEYAAGLQALKTISYYEGTDLLEDEAGFIALHFINGQQADGLDQVLMNTEVLQKVTLIVEDQLSIELNDQSLTYLRFITHLRFFLQRISSNETRVESVPDMYKQVMELYPSATECVKKIVSYLQDKLKCEIYPEEKMYLTLHIQRLLN